MSAKTRLLLADKMNAAPNRMRSVVRVEDMRATRGRG
jgi:hypothetical protein